MTFATPSSRKAAAGVLYSAERKMHHLQTRTDDPRAKRALANRFMHIAVGVYPYFLQITKRALWRRPTSWEAPTSFHRSARRV